MASPSTTLRDEHHLLSALVPLMQREQQCLISADSDALDQVTAQKSTLVLQLAGLANQRYQALGAAGFAASEAGMATWLASGAHADAARDWQALLDQTRTAKELNRVNGMLINKQMTNTQVVLNAMRTPAGAGEAGVYGPRGQTSAGGPSRRFVIG